MNEVHEVVSSVVAYQGRFLKIVRDQVRNAAGKIFNLEYVLHPGASVIIPVLDDGRFLMERQYRHAVKKTMIEFPAGKIDKGETPLETAKRELREETGYDAKEWKRLGVMHPCIGYSDEFIEVYLATGLVRQGDQKLDHGEELDTMTLSREELEKHIGEGALTDAKTVTAYLYYLNDAKKITR